MANTKRQILYVTKCEPWSQWCTSGFVMMLCRVLRREKLLLGAIAGYSPTAVRASTDGVACPSFDSPAQMADIAIEF